MTDSRAKGARGERELAQILRRHGYDSRRGQQYSGANGDADVVGIPGVHIECKRVERLNIYDAMYQSARDARDDEVPVAIHRKNGKRWLVSMYLENWLEIIGGKTCKGCKLQGRHGATCIMCSRGYPDLWEQEGGDS